MTDETPPEHATAPPSTYASPSSAWVAGACAHALALLLARRRFGPGVDMGGAHNPTPAEERDAAHFIRDLLGNGWLDPPAADMLRRDLAAALTAANPADTEPPSPAPPCPMCGQTDGFHDHGQPGSKHDAYQVPQHLVRPSNNRARARARGESEAAFNAFLDEFMTNNQTLFRRLADGPPPS